MLFSFFIFIFDWAWGLLPILAQSQACPKAHTSMDPSQQTAANLFPHTNGPATEGPTGHCLFFLLPCAWPANAYVLPLSRAQHSASPTPVPARPDQCNTPTVDTSTNTTPAPDVHSAVRTALVHAYCYLGPATRQRPSPCYHALNEPMQVQSISACYLTHCSVPTPAHDKFTCLPSSAYDYSSLTIPV